MLFVILVFFLLTCCGCDEMKNGFVFGCLPPARGKVMCFVVLVQLKLKEVLLGEGTLTFTRVKVWGFGGNCLPCQKTATECEVM